MTASPPPGPDLTGATDLVDQVLEGARANARPDLIRRLTAARDSLTAAPSPTPSAVRAAATTALQAIDSLQVDLRARQAMLADPARTARLHAELDRTRQRFEHLQSRAGSWGQVLGEGFATLQSDLEFRLVTGVRAVVAETEKAVNNARADHGRASLERWLDKRMAAEAEAAWQLLLDGTRTVAARVADHLALPAAPAVPAAAADVPHGLGAAVPTPPPPALPRRGPGRVLTVLMPTYGGVMMGLVLPRFLGLVLPGWLFAVGAVLGALTMGGAALTVERQQHREVRRNVARMALRNAIDARHLELAKQARDALRTLQQELRDATVAAATARAERLEQQYHSARAASELTTDAAVADVDTDLDFLAELRRRARTLLLPPPRNLARPGRPHLNVVA